MSESAGVGRTAFGPTSSVWRILMVLGAPVLLLVAVAAGLSTRAVPESVVSGSVLAAPPVSNGELEVAVLVDGAWEELGRLPYDQYPAGRRLALEGLEAEGAIKLRVAHTGETAAHIDLAQLEGQAPVDVVGAGEGRELALKKLGARDHDVVDVAGRTLVLTFDLISAPAALDLVARIEPAHIPDVPFQLPPENAYRTMDASCAFYTYRWGSEMGSLALDGELVGEGLGKPFFQELTEPGTGHPDGLAYGWVRNDAKHLYVALDFTSDNTADGDKDYAAVHVRTPMGLRSFRVSVPERDWGRPGFTYTPRVVYQHKVYELAIPVSELGLGALQAGAELDMAFSLYGTAAPAPQPFPGPLDPSFDGDGIVTTTIGTTAGAYGVTIQPDGKIVAAGYTDGDFAVARYSPGGGLDPTFGNGGVVTTSIGSGHAQANGVALQSSGKIIAAGYAKNGGDWEFAVARYGQDGTLDAGFGVNGVVTTSVGGGNDEGWAVAVQPDDKIVVAGYSETGGDYDFAVVRYDTAGALDAGFGSGGVMTTPVGSSSDYGRALAIQPDGMILVAGWSYSGMDRILSLVRYTDAGAVDGGFGSNGIVTKSMSGGLEGFAVGLQSDGDIVVGGCSPTNDHSDFALLRYDSGGDLDVTFGSSGVVTTAFGGTGAGSDDCIADLAIVPDDGIVAAGSNAGSRIAVAHYDADGAPEGGFGVGGRANVAIGSYADGGYAVDLQDDGRIVVAGYNYVGGSDWGFALVRYGRDLVMRKTVMPPVVRPGRPVTYTLTFSNTGASAKSAMIVDRIPISVTVTGVVSSGVPITTVSAGPVYRWAVGPVGYAEGGVITVTGLVTPPLPAQTFTNTATILFNRWESDQSNNSDGAAVHVPNLVPVADVDHFGTPEDTVLAIPAPGVLIGDRDGNNDSLTAVLETDVATGTLALATDGGFTYTPTLNHHGVVTFTYRASDGVADSNPALVTINVAPRNDAPVARDNAYTTPQDTPVSGNVLTDDTGDGVDSDVEGDTLRALLETNVATGWLALAQDGDFTYTPTLGYEGVVSFTYRARDAITVSNEAQVTITVGAAGHTIYLPVVMRQ